jgi:hypothetical protein
MLNKVLCNLNLCKPNTCLSWANSSVRRGVGLDRFDCTCICNRCHVGNVIGLLSSFLSHCNLILWRHVAKLSHIYGLESKPTPLRTEEFAQLRQVFGLHRFKLHRHLVDGTVKSVWFRQVFGLLRVRLRQVWLYYKKGDQVLVKVSHSYFIMTPPWIKVTWTSFFYRLLIQVSVNTCDC